MSDLDLSSFDNVVGQKLVDVRRVGLPVYWTQMEVLVEEKRDLHLISEYCLRLIDAGVSTSQLVISLLGLPPTITKVALAELLQIDAIAGDESSLKMTRLGKDLLSNYDVRCVEATWFTAFDGILKRPHPWRRDQLLTATQLVNAGHSIELNLFCDKPKAKDLDAGEVWSALVSVAREKPAERLLSIRSVRKAPIRFVPAVALAYKGEKGAAHVSFLVDGRPLDSHTRVFAESGGLKRPMFKELQVVDADAAQLRVNTRKRLVRRATGTQPKAPASGRLALPGKRDEPANGLSVPKVYDLSTRLQAITRSVTSRLIITTRGVSPGVLSSGILADISNSLGRGAKVWIGLGPDAIRFGSRGRPVEEWIDEFRELSTRNDGFKVFALPTIEFTHLIADSKLAIVGDYDWLSSDGSVSKHFRERWAIESVAPESVDREAMRVLAHAAKSTKK